MPPLSCPSPLVTNWLAQSIEMTHLALNNLTDLQSLSDSDSMLQSSPQNSQVLFRFFSILDSSSESSPKTFSFVAGAVFLAALLANCLLGAFDVKDLEGGLLPRVTRGKGAGRSEERSVAASGICLQSSSIAWHNCALSAHSI